MAKDFWNKRYAEREYAYGTSPNAFLKEQLPQLPTGRALFPAEGEGRNAVYAASLGWEVTAFDVSEEGKKKAEKLAAEYGVSLDYRLAGYEDVELPAASFDAICLVFAHMPPDKRREWHRKLAGSLKPGGRLLLEGFHKRQFPLASGGPKNEAMLFSKEEMLTDFEGMEILLCEEKTVVLDEGPFHQGEAEVVRLIIKR